MAPATLYEHTDIPPGMTCAEYRRALARPQKPGRLAKVGLVLLYPARFVAYLGEAPDASRRGATIYVTAAPENSPGATAR